MERIKTQSVLTVKPVSLLLLSGIFFLASGLTFNNARDAYRDGSCRQAIEIARRINQRSSHLPDQVRKDRLVEIRKWHKALNVSTSLLPKNYQEQFQAFEKEYTRIRTMPKGAAKTDRACELLRRLTLFSNRVRTLQAGCRCEDYIEDVNELVRSMIRICPAPCSDVEKQVEIMVNEVALLKESIQMSAEDFKARNINTFRERIGKYQEMLLKNKREATRLLIDQDFCLGRKGNRDLGLIIGSTEGLARGLGYLHDISGSLQMLHERLQQNAVENKMFRDSLQNFFSQVEGIMDQWLEVNLSDETDDFVFQTSVSDRMHKMFFRMAKIDMERSLFLLGSPVQERMSEIKRLRAMQFHEGLFPAEKNELTTLRDHVAQRLYLSIPWPVRFWHEQQRVAILVLCLGGCTLLLIVVLIAVLSKKSNPPREAGPAEKNIL